jgi:hypothetical protein
MQITTARDSGGVSTYAVRFADISNKWGIALASNVAQSITIPATCSIWEMHFGYEPGAEVWVADNVAATIPSGGTPTLTASEMNPIARIVNAGDVISLISPNGANVNVVIYPAK